MILPGTAATAPAERSQPDGAPASHTATTSAPAWASPVATGNRNGPVPATTTRRPASVC
jgi:hypothetical protein